jgi:serine/threonine protein phosphatase PrpC
MSNTYLEADDTRDEPSSAVIGSLTAVATVSNKVVNQDAAAVLENATFPCSGVVVADGIGSHYGADIAATMSADVCRAWVSQYSLGTGGINIGAICGEAVERLKAYCDEHVSALPEGMDWNTAFGTTLLIALDEPTHLQIGYVGNGAIIHLRGDFTTLPTSQLLPWNAMNYLNPHSFSHEGRNRLYKFLSPTVSMEQSTPTVLTLTKDLTFSGDIVVVCSDGICSFDQTRIGTDAEGNIWINGEPSLKQFYTALATFLADGQYTREALTETLRKYLSTIKDQGLVTDDCTIGVILTERALRFHSEKLALGMRAV